MKISYHIVLDALFDADLQKAHVPVAVFSRLSQKVYRCVHVLHCHPLPSLPVSIKTFLAGNAVYIHLV